MATDPTIEALYRMERFVVAVVLGGVTLVAGLWLVTLFGTFSTAWLAGAVLVLLGLLGLGAGIRSEVELDGADL